MRRRLGSILFAVALLGCGDDAGAPDTSSLEGVWIGAITGDAQDGTLEWRLTESNGTVSGEGSLSTASASVALEIEGTYQHPGLTLTMHPAGFEDIAFAGTVNDRIIKGRMTGAGLVNRTVTLERQP
jgi:hypothetical protein